MFLRLLQRTPCGIRGCRFMAELSDFNVADETQGLILEMSQSGALGELSAGEHRNDKGT